MYARCTRRYSTDRVQIKYGFSPMYAEIKYRSRTDKVQSRERTGKGNRFAEQGIVADLGSGTMGRRDHKREDKINSMAGETFRTLEDSDTHEWRMRAAGKG